MNAVRNDDKLHVEFHSRKGAGAPFNAYVYGAEMTSRAYAVRAGDVVRDAFSAEGPYHVRVDGPNGFMREFRGEGDPGVGVTVETVGGKARVRLSNASAAAQAFEIVDESYGAKPLRRRVAAGGTATVEIDPAAGQGWYDFTVRSGDLAYRYAGRVETGRWGVTDPAMGKA